MRTLPCLLVPGLLLALAPAAPAADKEAIQKAIDRGVASLRAQQQQNGSWAHQEMGATALAGLTLLECGEKRDDPAVQKAAQYVREASINCVHTYSLSLGIMFLDRLGEAADIPLIESMAVRLLAGQGTTGGWSYSCPNLSDVEARRIQNLVLRRNELVAGRDVPRPGQKREVKDLPKEIQLQLDQIRRNEGQQAPNGMLVSDNSNTQFATLALWVAHRNGIPVERALAKVDARFRATQNADGGWQYSQPFAIGPAPVGLPAMPANPSTPSMTCAGLLGLAAGYGAVNEAAMKDDKQAPKDPNKDPVIKAGLVALGSAIGNPLGAGRMPPGPNGVVGPGVAPGGFVPPLPVLGPGQNAQGYYFLWSLERVAVAYGLDTIGNKDWYAWGAEILLRNQGPDGSWQGEYGAGGVDTCFALLFLRRANIAQDLTATLKGKIQDPGEATLKAGGVGGADLAKGLGLKPAFDTSDKARKPAETKDNPKDPAPALDGEAAKLAEEFLGTQGKKQEEVLEKLRDSKGVVYTQALTAAIPKLSGPMKTKAREALAERMERMTKETLKDKLSDDDLEVRRAAALAVAMKEERSLVPRLIEMLADPEPPVSRAALASLKSLTRQDFGPDAEATRAERDKAIAEWKAWWARQGGNK